MSTFFGGRSEVRIRRDVRQVVLCDFLSMYPTVCTVMGLWRFVIADGMTWHDDTEAVRTLIEVVTLDDLQQRETWRRLATLVQIEPDGDVLPVRALYPGSDTATIGLNHLTAPEPLWFTLADCIAAKLLTGRTPRIVCALSFTPGKPQRGLRPVEINGDAAFRVRPGQDDFYGRLIELRQLVKRQRDAARGAERDRLDALQNALKIAANATSYGIFAEVTRVVLATAHRNHDTADNADANLAALCQRCHMLRDRPELQRRRRIKLRVRKNIRDLFDLKV